MSMDAQLNHAASEAAQESKPPRVPIERHVVACVLELERIRADVDLTLYINAEAGVRALAGWEQRPAGEADRLRAEARGRTDVIGNAIDTGQGAVRGYLDQNTHKPQGVPGQYADASGLG